MKLLVTGGAGFIGSNFIIYWLKKHPKDHIVNIDKLTYAGNLENLKTIENNSNYKFVHGDICDADIVNKVMQNIDVIVHFAADSHVDRSILDPDPFIKTNIQGTYTLLKAALNHKIKRFHHVSTDEVFGSLELDSNEKFNEKTQYNPNSPYAASKAGSDHLARAFYMTYNLPVSISNSSNNYGPYQFPEKLISLAITNLIEGKKIPVYGDGLYVRDWIYVIDHCKAIDAILHKGKIGETYVVGGLTNNISNLEVIEKILKIMKKDKKNIEFVKDRPGHDRKYCIDWNKIKTRLNWEPTENFNSGLQKTVDWYMNNLKWWKNVKSGEYKKYYEIQYKNKPK